MAIASPPTRLIPITEWDRQHIWPTSTAMRGYVAKEDTNGFKAHGVVKRVGVRVLIDEAAFFRWVDAQPGNGGDTKE